MSDNRLILLKTACHLFSQSGYDAVGVQEIVEEAGVTKPTLYHYFGSKQGLLATIFEYYFEPFDKSLNQHLDYKGDLQTSLRDIFQYFLDFSKQNTQFYRLWMTTRLAPNQSIPYQVIFQYSQKHQNAFLQFFLQVSKQHGNMRQHELIIANSFQGFLFSYVSMVLQGEVEMDQPQINRAIHQFMHGIFS